MAGRRKGRGRLSSIDLLPEAAGPAIAWAMDELRNRDLLQTEILEKFNEKLKESGVEETISPSAFNRHSIRMAATARRLEETQAIASTITERLGPGEADQLTVMAAETIKTLIFEILETSEGGKISTKGAMELARALQSAVSAQSVSTERRRKIEQAFAADAAKAIGKVGAAKGLSTDTIEEIKAGILFGVGK